MSAPFELWLNEYGVKSREMVSNGSRYLRADLTCGECAWKSVNSERKCAHSWPQNIMQNGGPFFTPDDDYPACMAFVPRETK